MLSILVTGILTALALIFLLLKLDIKKVLGYDVLTDVALSLLLIWAMSGTFAGVMAALIAGGILSVFLYVMKRMIGFKRLERKGFKWHWVEYVP